MGSSIMISKLLGLEFEPRLRIFSLRVILAYKSSYGGILAYKSSYGGVCVAQTSGPPERNGEVLIDT
jgi:hypothetical protein